MDKRRHGGLWTLLGCLVPLALGLGAEAALAQTIDSVSGDPVRGGTLTISGSAFGTKANAAPVKWEDFESGTLGRDVTTADGWDMVNGYGGSGETPPFYDNTATHSGDLAMTCAYEGGAYNVSVRKNHDFKDGFYLDMWYRYDPASPASRNHKIWELYGSGAGDYPACAMTGGCDLGASIEIAYYAGPNYGDAEWTGATFNHLTGPQMHHLQAWVKPSTPGVSDGIVWLAIDGVVKADVNDKLTVMPNIGYWNHLRLGFYMAHDGIPGCPSSGDAYTYFDDVYFDETQARVEIGNNPVYSACTHREIQIPTDWSSSQVTVNFNPGTFGVGETAYVFVVDADGNPSAGRQITIGGTATEGPGRPGKPYMP